LTKPTAIIKPQEPSSSVNEEIEGKTEEEEGRNQPIIEAEQVVHLVPVENLDGSISYMLVSLNSDLDQIKLNTVVNENTQQQQQLATTEDENYQNLEAIYIDKTTDLSKIILSSSSASASSSSSPQQPSAAAVIVKEQPQQQEGELDNKFILKF